MRAHSNLSLPLRECLLAVLRGGHTSRQLNSLVNLFVAFAIELLGRKTGSRRITSSQGLTEKDLAFDSIAELFQRNELGTFVQLEAYFAGFELETISTEELLIAVRRLVYSRVNQSLFRIYHDVDPVFSKILRNIKLAIESMKQFDEVERFGETLLKPAMCDSQEHLPEIDPDDAKRHLLSVCFGNENIPQMLGKLANVLRQQETHSRLISLMNAATIIQSVYAIKNEPLLGPSSVESTAFADELATTIKSACGEVKTEYHRKYVQKQKVSGEIFDRYFEVIERILLAQSAGNGADTHYFDLLKMHLPALTQAEYKATHKAKLEYLGLLVQKRVANEMRSEA